MLLLFNEIAARKLQPPESRICVVWHTPPRVVVRKDSYGEDTDRGAPYPKFEIAFIHRNSGIPVWIHLSG
jgi:hypothetical protein